MRRILPVIGVALLSAGCAMGPNYKRPAAEVPPQFRSAPADSTGAASLADTKWFDRFQDDALKQLIATAIEQNFDLKIASARVLEARAQYGIQKSLLFPELDAGGQLTTQRTSTRGAFPYPAGFDSAASFTQAGFSLSWELDVWGRLRRLNEAARAEYLASEEGRRGVLTTLIADVSTAYFDLREKDLELDIARRTKQNADRGLQLTTLRHKRGAATGLDVHQAEQLLFTATAQIASAERGIGQTENQLSLLLGRSPGAVSRGKELEQFALPPTIPPGLPSALLERRPDIRGAEASLIAANAQIGAAKAQYFPQISLTGFLGGQSRELSSLFTGPARQWSFIPAATLPVFNAGRTRNNVRFARAQQQEAVFVYQKAIQNAFREVSDALIGYQKTAEQREQEEHLVKALRETERLSNLRYRGGLDSYLQVLDAQRNLFQGELALAQLRRDELLAVVELYRALGGGWQ
ncbi:MAG TPA: efflux transporter outer membrane subunit [Bryobacteraceae bacterium]|jgi:multidrug efflux system outer membrane protein|nr:efflux transporter outer membrane subunit [Bryobacteraceae bacterium]